MNETQFTIRVLDYLKLKGWVACHFRPAYSASGRVHTALQGDAGCPDVIAFRNGDYLMVELKVGRNKLSDLQVMWRSHIDDDHYMLLYPDGWEQFMERAA